MEGKEMAVLSVNDIYGVTYFIQSFFHSYKGGVTDLSKTWRNKTADRVLS